MSFLVANKTKQINTYSLGLTPLILKGNIPNYLHLINRAVSTAMATETVVALRSWLIYTMSWQRLNEWHHLIFSWWQHPVRFCTRSSIHNWIQSTGGFACQKEQIYNVLWSDWNLKVIKKDDRNYSVFI